MTAGAASRLRTAGTAGALARAIADEGSAAHGYPPAAALTTDANAARNLADAVHHLCILHGRLPGVVDLALEGEPAGPLADWLRRAADGFALERGVLTRLAVAAGPLPSTPGQADCEATVLGQRHALEMLARSSRAGCALGAAIALVGDWRAIRDLLGLAADRFGIIPSRLRLPPIEDALAEVAALDPPRDRALAFGVAQLLAQHRGLWNLLEAREIARRGR